MSIFKRTAGPVIFAMAWLLIEPCEARQQGYRIGPIVAPVKDQRPDAANTVLIGKNVRLSNDENLPNWFSGVLTAASFPEHFAEATNKLAELKNIDLTLLAADAFPTRGSDPTSECHFSIIVVEQVNALRLAKCFQQASAAGIFIGNPDGLSVLRFETEFNSLDELLDKELFGADIEPNVEHFYVSLLNETTMLISPDYGLHQRFANFGVADILNTGAITPKVAEFIGSILKSSEKSAMAAATEFDFSTDFDDKFKFETFQLDFSDDLKHAIFRVRHTSTNATARQRVFARWDPLFKCDRFSIRSTPEAWMIEGQFEFHIKLHSVGFGLTNLDAAIWEYLRNFGYAFII